MKHIIEIEEICEAINISFVEFIRRAIDFDRFDTTN